MVAAMTLGVVVGRDKGDKGVLLGATVFARPDAVIYSYSGTVESVPGEAHGVIPSD